MTKRRSFLKSVAALAIASRSTASAGASALDADTKLRASLRAFVDTLIPADETPAGSALGIDGTLFGIIARDVEYRRHLEAGLRWMDRSARAIGASSFAAATEQERVSVVERAERAKAGTAPRTLFEHVRTDAMSLYYAHPSVWPALGFAGPPQPAGYLDFERPPAPRR